ALVERGARLGKLVLRHQRLAALELLVGLIRLRDNNRRYQQKDDDAHQFARTSGMPSPSRSPFTRGGVALPAGGRGRLIFAAVLFGRASRSVTSSPSVHEATSSRLPAMPSGPADTIPIICFAG